jgi:hypothetical protein
MLRSVEVTVKKRREQSNFAAIEEEAFKSLQNYY